MLVVVRERTEQLSHRNAVRTGNHVRVLRVIDDTTLDVENRNAGTVDTRITRSHGPVTDNSGLAVL